MLPPKFIVTSGNRKPANKLEAHLLATAQAWCAQESVVFILDNKPVTVKTVSDFYNALVRERSLYCRDNRSAKEESIHLTLLQPDWRAGDGERMREFDSIGVRPSGDDLSLTFMVTVSPQDPS